MRRRLVVVTTVALSAVVLPPLVTAAAAGVNDTVTYTPGTVSLATITNGTSPAPWNLQQGDLGFSSYTSQSPGTILPTYTPGGATTSIGGVTEPNLAVYPGADSTTDGAAPYPSGTVGTPGPLDGYCGSGNQTAESQALSADAVTRQPAGTFPFSPYYFPHVVRTSGTDLEGYFDYRPKDADEAIVAASSTDNGNDWTYQSEALEQNPELCPSADVNDDGQGHPNVISVGGTTYIYTLERGAGDNIGAPLLVHPLDPTSTNPLNGAPATEQTGIDPDDFAAAGVDLSTSPQAIDLTEPVGTGVQQLLAGEFVDLTRTPVPAASSVIDCTSVGAQSLGGCTTAAAGGIDVLTGDLIEQVIATVGGAATIPAGPNTTTGDGGLSSLSVTFASQLTAATFNDNAPNRAYVDGVAVYCNNANALPTTKIEDCTTGPGGSPLSVTVGDPVTSDPIVPATAEQTTGLVAPDGIVGVLPSFPDAPAGDTVILYTEKVLNYYDVGYTGGATTFSANMSIPFTAFPNSAAAPLPATVSPSSPVTVAIGDNTNGTIVDETCTGLTGTTLSGCNGGPVGDAIAKNSYIGAPGACTASQAALSVPGEGSTSAAKLLKNNEDLTVLRAAYTADGTTFSSAGLPDDGIISGLSDGASDYTDITNPSLTTSPSNLNAYATPGTQDATEMRFVGSSGTVLTNSDGTYGMFLSGSWCADGDSDAFNQVFYTQSTDGENWSVPTSVVSTDYTFSASAAQDSALAGGHDDALDPSAYYSGRAYGPSVVANGDGTYTMVFAGYRAPKPIPTVGTTLGEWTVEASDPALYRDIMTVTLTATPAGATPESPSTVLLPVAGAGIVLVATAVVLRRRRRGVAES